MTSHTARRLAWSLCGVCIALVVAWGVFVLANYSAIAGRHGLGLSHQGALIALTFPTVGALIASSRRDNAIGWIFIAIGLSAAGWALNEITAVTSRPGPDWNEWLQSWIWAPAWFLMVTFLLLLFPDGRLPSRKWRPVAWLAGASIGLQVITSMIHPNVDPGDTAYTNPLVDLSGRTTVLVLDLGLIGGVALGFVAAIVSLISLIHRFRRSQGEKRQQIKWFAYAGVLTVVLGIGRTVLATNIALQAIGLISIPLIPIATGIAILKYRLYDIDVVINKTVVFGALAAFITVIYVGIVVGVGTLIGSGDKPNLGLSILATAIVAVAFQPVRERVQHFANRLVYGKRASPYEVLSEFSDRVAETYALEEVLPKMAQAIKDGTGAERAEVWLRSHNELRPAATWPEDTASGLHPLPLNDGRLPSFESADKAIEVRHQGELLGALTVTKPQGEPLTPAEDKLLADLASQAGLVLRNVGLTAELLQRLEELKASRQRLVAAQDEERRRLERDLHDGAQQHLVALKTRLALARKVAAKDAEKAKDLIAKLEGEADEALETLRDLARGIYPPLLADQGLKAALEAHVRKLSIPVEVKGDDISRYSQEIEAAIYFCCLEALQNVTKYASASRAVVRLSQQDGALTLSVEDDGAGFDRATTKKGSGTQNMVDRLEALGGHLDIESELGKGTNVIGHLPVEMKALVA